jgi:hypothetical protein
MELRRVPQLRELHVQVHIGMDAPSALTVACPLEAAMIAGCYANHAYASIRLLRLTLQWLLPRGMEDPAERFMKQTPDGFARLDDLLSDERILSSLEQVEIVLQPSRTNRGTVAAGVDDGLRRRIHNETLEAFEKTTRRVDNFVIETSSAFKCMGDARNPSLPFAYL